ncbi:MAG: DNA polymerase I, partial [Bacteroidales bacterium]|nr:DNA polymerase I [Bacteroidales bacterium]
MKKRLLLLDAYALIYRAYYAFINRPMRNSKGMNTSAIYGFIRATLDAIKKFNPTHVAVAFDVSGKTFRNDIYPDYKAQRDETPEDIRASVPVIKNLLNALNIPIIEKEGFEADDVIGTLATKANPKEFEVIMMTPDKDYGQLLSENIIIAKPGRSGNEMEIVTAEQFCKDYDIQDPKQFIDILALWGDASDNIKGVNKVGEKTAAKLISQFGSIDNLLQNLDKLSPAQRENFEAALNIIPLNRKLVSIVTNIDLNVDIENDLAVKPPKTNELVPILEELEFRSMLKEFTATPKVEKPQYVQGSLFDMPATETPKPAINLKTINDFEVDYRIAQTTEERRILIKELENSSEFAFDTETTGLDPISVELVGLSFAISPRKAWWVPVPSDQNQAKEVVKEFANVFGTETIAKVGQNIKFDMQVLLSYGIDIKGHLYDTMLAHYLLEPDSRHNLDYLSEIYLSYKPISIEELIGKKGSKQGSMRNVEATLITRYACEDADLALQLKHILFSKLEEQGLTNLYFALEAPLVEVLTYMERNGVSLDTKSLKDYGEILSAQLVELESEIRQMAGVPDLNISSPKQLGEVLFEKLKISSDAKLTKTRQYSTNEEEL